MYSFLQKFFLSFILMFTLSSCTYEYQEQSFRVSDGSTKVLLTLGESRTTHLYNFKSPQEIVFQAPKNYSIVFGDKKTNFFSQTLQPQESLSLQFTILKRGSPMKDSKSIEQIILSFKEEMHPSHQRPIMTTNGKSQSRYGDSNFFTLSPYQTTALIELHEYNSYTLHKFYFQNQKNDLQIILTPPNGHSFIFDKNSTKKYELILSPQSTVSFSMSLKADWSNTPYERIYYFISQ